MELQPEAVQRLLDALSPALNAELDRVVKQTHEILEAEFRKRLEAALQDAQASAQRRASEQQREADERLRQSVAETQENVRREVTEQLESRFKNVLEETSNKIRSELEATTNSLRSEWDTERERLQEQLDQWQVFAEAQKKLSEASSQTEILVRFLKFAEPYAAGVAVYVTKSDGLALWKTRGSAVFPEIVSEETIDPDFYFKKVMVKGRTVAAVCAAQPYRIDVLSFLASSLERAVEVFGLKLRAPASKPEILVEKTVATVSAPVAGTPVPTPASQGTAPAIDEKVHAEARRTARLLISEIKLYHEQELRVGREHSDIYQRLQKEIDHGREVYSQRVPGEVRGSRDYFHEELVRILTENDPSRLGEAYPGPINNA